MLRHVLVLLLLCTSAVGSAAQPKPFSTGPLSVMVLSKPGGPVGDIAFAHKGDIYTVTLDGKHFRRLTNDGRNAFPLWSHDGARVAFTNASKPDYYWASADIWIATPDGKYSHPITKAENLSPLLSVAWLPDNTGLLVMKHYLESDVSPTLEVVMRDAEPYPPMKTWMEVSRKAKFVQQFVEGPVEFTSGQAADFSSDGKQMIFTAATKWLVDAPQLDIYRMNADGSGLKRLQSMPDSVVYCLRWNDQANRLLSVEECWTCEPNERGIWLRDSQGNALKKLADVGKAGHNMVDWSPDGKQIIYSLTDEKYLDWSPGSFAEMSDHCSLWIMNADGSGKYKIADNACTPSWR